MSVVSARARPRPFFRRLAVAAPVTLATFVFCTAAHAQSAPASAPPAKQPEAGFEASSLFARPHTIAEAEFGFLALPSAPISAANKGGDISLGGGQQFLGKIGNGDATLQVGVHILYRAGKDWAIGAGAMFAPRPSSDENYVGNGAIKRTHSRSYLTLGGEGRYYPLRYRWFEVFIGLTAGAVVIADRFATQGPDPPTILGTREYTVRTEGFGLGVQAGGDYILTDNWVIGLKLRADRWVLPNAAADPQHDPACSSIGDCPTLTGSVAAFEFGVSIGYRIPL
jgi:hypothetical protein